VDSDIESFLAKHARRALIAQECAGGNHLFRQGPPLAYLRYQDSGIGYFKKDLSYACWETL
jgi:hypothetical protein